MNVAYCLDCDNPIKLDQKGVGTVVECTSCDARFQIIDIEPVELDWTYETSSSWDQLMESEEELYEADEENLWSWKVAKDRRKNEYGPLHDRRRNGKGSQRNNRQPKSNDKRRNSNGKIKVDIFE